MKLEYIVCDVKDSHGNRDALVCNEMSDTVQICGMKNKEGENVYFESDAHHLFEWCDSNGLTYSVGNNFVEI